MLINQLKEVSPAIQKSISECTEKVNSISANLPPLAKHHGGSTSPIQAQSSGRAVVIFLGEKGLIFLFGYVQPLIIVKTNLFIYYYYTGE